MAVQWEGRAETYETLIHESRNIRGLLGNGGPAAAQAAKVTARAQRLARETVLDAKPLRQLDRLFKRIDARRTEVIEQGVSERLYFLRLKLRASSIRPKASSSRSAPGTSRSTHPFKPTC